MNKVSIKRTRNNEDESSGEMVNTRKRLKLEEIILAAVSTEGKNLDQFSENNITRRRNKLLTAIQLRKRYKYFCKKHNVTYLIQSVRQKSKEVSKTNRNNLVQTFRSLDVSSDSRKLSEGRSVCNLDEDKNASNKNQFDNNSITNVEKDSVVTPKLPTLLPKKKRSATEDIMFDEDEYTGYLEDVSNAWSSEPKVLRLSNMQNNLKDCNIVLSDDEDKDYFAGLSNAVPIDPKLFRHSTMKKTSIKNKIMFEEDEESDSFDYFPKTWASESKLSKGLSLKKKIEKNNIILDEEEDEDSDYARYCEKSRFKKYKVIKSLVVRKNPGENKIIFSEGEDYITTDADAEDSECHCHYHDNLKTRFCNYEYFDSSSEDESSLYSDTSFTG